jgi:hypothetical protein
MVLPGYGVEERVDYRVLAENCKARTGLGLQRDYEFAATVAAIENS